MHLLVNSNVEFGLSNTDEVASLGSLLRMDHYLETYSTGLLIGFNHLLVE
jgi:hypothetical protein